MKRRDKADRRARNDRPSFKKHRSLLMPAKYEKIRDSLKAKGVSSKRAKSIAAATYVKQAGKSKKARSAAAKRLQH